MSQLLVNTIQGAGNVVRVEKPNVLNAPGHVIDVSFNVSMERFYYKIPNNDNATRGSHVAEAAYSGGIILRPLDITVTPKSVNNWIHVEFNMFFEAHHDNVFNILRDGNWVGGQLYGGDQNQSRWNGMAVSRYDNNNDSTPSYLNVSWMDCPGTISPVTYSIAVRTSNGNNRDMVLNGTFANYENGGNAYEQGVSFTIAQEIAN